MIDHSIKGWIEPKELSVFLDSLKEQFGEIDNTDAVVLGGRINIDFKFVSTSFCNEFTRFINDHEESINYAYLNIHCEELDYHDPVNGVLLQGHIEVYESKFHYSQIETHFPINTFEDAICKQTDGNLPDEYPNEKIPNNENNDFPF